MKPSSPSLLVVFASVLSFLLSTNAYLMLPSKWDSDSFNHMEQEHLNDSNSLRHCFFHSKEVFFRNSQLNRQHCYLIDSKMLQIRAGLIAFNISQGDHTKNTTPTAVKFFFLRATLPVQDSNYRVRF